MAARNPNVEVPVPSADQWKRAPYLRTTGDPFWGLAGAYPVEGPPAAVPTFFTAPVDLGRAELVNPSSVIRFRSERGDFPHVEYRFGAQASPPTDWAEWVDEVLGTPQLRQVVVTSGALEAVQLSRLLSIPRQGAANKNLEFACSRWCIDTHSFVWAWGESGISLEDVHILTRLSLRRGNTLDLAKLARADKGADDKCYSCVFQEEDNNKKIGVALSKDLMAVAGEALKTNITTLGPLILPMSEQLLFFATLVDRKVLKMKIKPYIPDFQLAVEHFCIHSGGKAVLDELEKNLDLSEWHMEPSRMTLYRFGNISSSSLWYELAYTEAKGRIRRGDRTWQIAFGSGFKCNSAVWKALGTVDPTKEKNPWMDEIHEFPVHVPKVAQIVS